MLVPLRAIAAFAMLALAPACLAGAPPHRVTQLKIQILSTNLTSGGGQIGEWGFAAMVVADGHAILFDTGTLPDTVLHNARSLGVDLTAASDVVLSHSHGDHTRGLIDIRKTVMAVNPAAASRTHVGQGIFLSRPGDSGERNQALKIRASYEALGGRFTQYDKPAELLPGVWLTGPIPRPNPEQNWGRESKILTEGGLADDTVPEDMAMVFNTGRGLVVLSGCGHAGIVNTLQYARQIAGPAPIHAAIGGFHVFALADEKLKWTAEALRKLELQNFLGAHCTGVETVYQLRALLGLTRKTCSVAAVGATFELGKELQPGSITR